MKREPKQETARSPTILQDPISANGSVHNAAERHGKVQSASVPTAAFQSSGKRNSPALRAGLSRSRARIEPLRRLQVQSAESTGTAGIAIDRLGIQEARLVSCRSLRRRTR